MVRTLRDPDGGNLDRIQIIKGWLDPKGEVHERIFDVAVSDGRRIDADRRCTTPVGNPVDVPNATLRSKEPARSFPRRGRHTEAAGMPARISHGD